MNKAKEEAIDYLEREAMKHKGADTYDTVENEFAEDIDKAIDIALKTQAKEIFEELRKQFRDNDIREGDWILVREDIHQVMKEFGVDKEILGESE